MVADAKKVIETDPDVGAHNVLVVGGDGWHRGVIGIAASKLVDAFHKPSIVLSIDGDEVHGSCRSIPAFDMLAALESLRRSVREVRRPSPGRGVDDGAGEGEGVPEAHQRRGRMRGWSPTT